MLESHSVAALDLAQLASGCMHVTSRPSTSTVPASGRRSPRMVRSSTDLPLPDPPTMPKISALLTSKLTPSCTTCAPKRLTTSRTADDRFFGAQKSISQEEDRE